MVPIAKFIFFAAFTALPGLTLMASAAQPLSTRESSQIGPIAALRPGITEQRVFAELVAHNGVRAAALIGYTALRTYQVSDAKGKMLAQEVGRMEYQAPDKKAFVVTAEKGSAIIRHLALTPLIESEIKTAAGQDRTDSAITPANYSLKLLGEQDMEGRRCFVAEAFPKRVDKYLFEGKVWIEAHDYAIVRIEGHPAANLSFWIKRAAFIRRFQKIDGFWLPERDETFVQVRFYGNTILTIDHRDYVIRGHTA